MTQINILNVTFSKYQLNKLKSGVKNVTEVTQKLSSSVAVHSNEENSNQKILVKLLST